MGTVIVNLEPGPAVPAGFIGISQDHNDVADIVGAAGGALNPAYYQLLKNLALAGATPLCLRVEGDPMSPTETLPGAHGGVPCQPQAAMLAALRALADTMDIEFILGVDMASGSPAWAAAQVEAYLKYIPAAKIAAFEVGNEPDNYVGQGYRPAGWTAQDYLAEWDEWRTAMVVAARRELPLEGPAAAGSGFLAATIAELKSGFPVALYGQHWYPYGKSAANAPDLLLQASPAGGYTKYVAQTAPAPFRQTEMNSVAGGGQAGISDAFQAALWLIEAGCTMAAAGMAGFNFHTGQYTDYALWEFTASPVNGARQLLTVHAPYYGLLVLAELLGNGARLLSIGGGAGSLTAWATLDAAGAVRVALINKSNAAVSAAVEIASYETAAAKLLTAPGYAATSGITYGGQTFDGAAAAGAYAGKLLGASVAHAVDAAAGVFTVSVPAVSAVVLRAERS